MRIVFLLINFFLYCTNIFAQGDSTTLVENYTTQFGTHSATVSIFMPIKNKSVSFSLLYFITGNDSLTKESGVNKAFNQFADSSLPCVLVKISFDDSSAAAMVTNEFFFVESRLQIEKKYADHLRREKIIIAAQNQWAPIVLSQIKLPANKIIKAGLFFDNMLYSAINISDTTHTAFKNLPGKIFIYLWGNNTLLKNVNSFADDMALSSFFMMYKVEQQNNEMPQSLIREFYSWIMADGNNYIIKP